ncbi:MAG: UvrD-helicase domain-containing protein, partial [Candidatus Hydrogenedentes bacterium]|nr:UvrD-helicase domain-containing protein [Candidatus Hydrogenedentota bacterium]
MNFTPEQYAAITSSNQHLCVTAGAGSGKTRVLIEHILHLLETRAAGLDEIVAITFTELAAAEMKERLRRGCRERMRQPKAQADSGEYNFWRDLERRAETARISTIHAFCGSILRENALLRGLDPDFSVLTEPESQLLLNDVTISTLNQLLETDDAAALDVCSEFGLRGTVKMVVKAVNERGLLNDLNPMFEHPGKNALAQYLELIELGNENLLLLLRFSPKLKTFLHELDSFDGLALVKTDKRECIRVEMIDAINRILDAQDATTILEALTTIAEVKASGTRIKNWPSEEIQTLLKDLQNGVRDFAKKYITPEVDEEWEAGCATLCHAFYELYRKVATAYQAGKAERNALDFNDYILHARDLLREFSAEGTLPTSLTGIRYLLLDEFQDTDRAQYEITRALTTAANGPKVFIVGDAKQSIYGWRGADVSVFKEAQEEDSEAPLRLATNFRALPDVMNFVNHFFAASDLLRQVEPDYVPMATHRPALNETRVEFILTPPETDAKALDYRRNEGQLLAHRIKTLCGPEGITVECDGEIRPASFGDVAILLRSTSNLHLYTDALQEAGIPYVVASGGAFFRQQEFIDFHNLLSLAVDPWDEVALLAFLRGPMICLSDDALVRLCKEKPLSRVFHEGGEELDDLQQERLNEARAVVCELREARCRPLQDFLRFALARTGFEAILLGQFMGAQKSANVRKVVELAGDFSRLRPPMLDDFVLYTQQLSEREIREADAAVPESTTGAVRLMTIHTSKGLEFPIVALGDLSFGQGGHKSDDAVYHREYGVGLRPKDDSGESRASRLHKIIHDTNEAEALAESARLLYVAMTRARDYLLLSGSPNTRDFSRSWLKYFDEVYGLCDRKDAETIPASDFANERAPNEIMGWSVRVTAAAGEQAAESDQDAASASLIGDHGITREDMERWVQPVQPSSSRRTFTVTELAGGHEGEAPSILTGQPREPKPAA